MTFEHKNLDELKGKFEDGDRPIGEDFARLLDSCHNTYQDTSVEITGSLTVAGASEFRDAVSITSNLAVGGTLGVAGSVLLSNTLSVAGATSINDILGVTGNTILGATLSVAKETVLSDTLTVKKDTELQSNLNVTGDTVTTNLTATSNAIIHNTLDVGSNASIGGDTSIDGMLNVTGHVTLAETLDVSGPTTIGSLLDVAGSVHLAASDELIVLRGNINAEQNATFDKNVHIKGNLRVDGNAYLSAGAGGVINVGDSDDDNLVFNADVASNVSIDADKLYSLGSTDKKWLDIYTQDIIVDGLVDGRDISDDGDTLDSVYASVNTTSGTWNDVYNNVAAASARRDAVYANVASTSAKRDSVWNNVTSNSADWQSVYSDVSNTSGTWNDVYNNVATASARRESVYTNVNSNSSDWNDVYVTTKNNSADWFIDTMEELKDVDVTGVVNNSILKYEANIGKWVVSTVDDDDIRATAQLQAVSHNGTTTPAGQSLILTDNSNSPVPRTVTFTASAGALSGVYVRTDDTSYVFGTSSLTDTEEIAFVTTNIINKANVDDNLSIYASVVGDVISLTQLEGGPGGNTDIVGDATGNQNDTFLHGFGATDKHHPKFEGGEAVDNFESLSDTPGGYGNNAGNFVKVNTNESGLEFVSHPTDQWDDVYSFVNGDSATNNSDFNQTAYVNASGDTIAGDLNVTGQLSANTAIFTSMTAVSSFIDVVDIKVRELSGFDIIDGNLTVHGDISATGDVYLSDNSLRFSGGEVFSSDDSKNVKSTYTSVCATSSEWDSVYSSVCATSAEWDSVYSSVCATSSEWDSVYSSVCATSSEWDSVYTDVSQTSAEWDSVYSSVCATSSEWDSVYTDVSQTSAEWDSVYNSVCATSAEWDNVYTDVSDTSAEWDSVYTDVSETSAEWDSVYSYINTASGLGIATVDANGKLLESQIPELSITRVHAVTSPSEVAVLNPATGIQIGDVVVVASTHDNLIAIIDSPAGTYTSGTGDYDGYAKLALPDGLVRTVNGKPGPSVVLNPDDLDDTSTAHKFISTIDSNKWNSNYNTVNTTSAEWTGGNSVYNTVCAISAEWNDVYTDVSQTSAEWNDVYTDVSQTSAEWDSVYSSVCATSSEWDSVYTDVSETSAEWDSVYSSVCATSSEWDSVYTDVSETSGEWNSVYSWVNTDSATNNSDFNQTAYVNASGDKMTGKLEIVSSELEVGGNITMAGDLIHQDDTGTKISFNTDTITLEANGQEFITIDGSQPTPDSVIVNEAGTEPVHFIIKTPSDGNALYFRGSDGSLGLGTSALGTKLNVVGGVSASEGITIGGNAIVKGTSNFTGDVVIKSSLTATDGDFTGSVSTSGEYISAGVALHDIFSTNTDIRGDLTVHGSISSTDDTTIDGSLSANEILARTAYHTLTGANVKVTGVTEDINIGGHVLHIVNGLIVKVSDE